MVDNMIQLDHGRGLFVPPWFDYPDLTELDSNLGSVFWGMTWATAVFSSLKAAQQTRRTWKGVHRITAYIAMVWGEVIACVIMSIVLLLSRLTIMPTNFWLFFIIVFIWCFQVQFLIQILANRVGLLICVPSRVTRLKRTVFGVILVINISVFIIWIPSRLQISYSWILADRIWDRTQKVIFLIIDASLNGVFIYIMRTQLIENGLTKYKPLFRFNTCIIFFSISLDVVQIGLMSASWTLIYVQFQCLAYLTKLNIEMSMADMIRRVAHASNDTPRPPAPYQDRISDVDLEKGVDGNSSLPLPPPSCHIKRPTMIKMGTSL
ncbi:hypothetical protein F4779DRAFT_627681 [Xylariaceae sp. FL0662B]|nr:hypothetical protein F4779DRAFT_627681 [Xylariaceae sp. FL0662B]